MLVYRPTVRSQRLITTFRADGWPLCPACDTDELYSLLTWDGMGERPPLQDYLEAGLLCYLCGTRYEKERVDG